MAELSGMLGVGYGLLAIGMLLAGAYQQRGLLRSADRAKDRSVNFATVSTFTIGGVLLTIATVVLVIAQS